MLAKVCKCIRVQCATTVRAFVFVERVERTGGRRQCGLAVALVGLLIMMIVHGDFVYTGNDY